MDRIWQWAWDRYGAWYSRAIWLGMTVVLAPAYVVYALAVVALEGSSRYLEAAGFVVLAVAGVTFVLILPGSRRLRLAELSAGGREIDRVGALQDTYVWARTAAMRAVWVLPVWSFLAWLGFGVIAEASQSRLIQYGVIGVVTGLAAAMVGLHAFVEGAVRPARAALAGETGIGDALPRSRPTFAAWLQVAMLASFFVFSFAASMWTTVLEPTRQ